MLGCAFGDNPAAVPSRKLVMDLYTLVAAAQARA